MMRKSRKLAGICCLLMAVSQQGASATEGEPMDFNFGRMGVLVPPDSHAPAGAVKDAKPSVSVDGKLVRFANAHYSIDVSTESGLHFSAIHSNYANAACLTAPSRVLMIWVEEKQIPDDQISYGEPSVSGNSVTIPVQVGGAGLTGELKLSIDDTTEMRLEFAVKNESAEVRNVRAMFPMLENLQIGTNADDNYYYYPYKGGLTSNMPFRIQAAYANPAGTLQLLSIYNPALGAGVYTRAEDTTGRQKTVLLQKKSKDGEEEIANTSKWHGEFAEFVFNDLDALSQKSGSTVGMFSFTHPMQPGETMTFPAAVIGIHQGDHTVALARYKEWMGTWWKHHGNIPDWFKDVFYYPVAHDILGNTGWTKGFERNGKLALAEIARPYEDMIQLAYWWGRAKDDRFGIVKDEPWYRHTIGDFTEYNESWGGAEGLKKEIQTLQKEKGTRISLYGSTTWAVWFGSKVYEQHKDWVRLDRAGNEVRDYWMDVGEGGKERLRYVDMCIHIPEWQQYVADTNARIVRETGAAAIYLDTLNLSPPCYAPNHKHSENRSEPVEHFLKINLEAVRSADPEAVVEVEDSASEFALKYVDGVWEKTFYRDLPERTEVWFDQYSVSFIRFLIPEVKWTLFGPFFQQGGRRALFNGMGYSLSELQDIKDDAGNVVLPVDRQVDYLIAACQLMKQSGDAFGSLDVQCLVPTVARHVYANRFTGQKTELYTIYNKNDEAFDGQALQLPESADHHWVELLHDNEMPSAGWAQVGPWQVGCIAKLPIVMDAKRTDSAIEVALSDIPAKEKLIAILDNDDGRDQGTVLEISNGKASFDLQGVTARRVILKLMGDGHLVDQRVIDLK